jgi:hypothetical protein
METHPRVDVEDLQSILIQVLLAGLKRTPRFAAVREVDLRAGVGSVDADERERDARNLGVHVVLYGRRILIWKNMNKQIQGGPS